MRRMTRWLSGCVCPRAGKRVGRVARLLEPEAVQAEVDARSIAANPLPYDITMEEVESFFREHGEVDANRFLDL